MLAGQDARDGRSDEEYQSNISKVSRDWTCSSLFVLMGAEQTNVEVGIVFQLIMIYFIYIL